MNYEHLSFDHIPFLKRYVNVIYKLATGEETTYYKTVINGLIGISFILRGSAKVQVKQKWVDAPRISIFGMANRPSYIQLSPHFYEVVVGFKPHHFQLFISEQMSRLSKGEITDASCLFQKDELHDLYDQLGDPSLNVLPIITHFLQHHYQENKINPRLKAVSHLITHQHLYKVEDIASELNVTSATLRNLFREHIGLSPKELIKINRINRALHLQKALQHNLSALSYELGYFDQAHFIHEFKHTIGLSPKKYFNNQRLIFDFYNYERWLYDNFVS